ncbi:uncharacterized protein LOC129951166 [Eupeodes corollae]|uniref:uncharacterized protein LOC129951166 n=1 Tax=Eupeodes corollae TaxID=290404 RepID=UPI0024905DBF|nr:uncharacterized protein LOC129951166 [Eupeodes corollae]
MKRLSTNFDESTEITFEEKLIAAIEKHSCLYDKNAVNYRKKSIKQNAWEEVAADVRSNVKECKYRWRSLRDRYVREIRENSNCKWKYMNRLSFLNPYLRNSNISSTEEEVSCSALESFTQTIEYEEENKNMNQQVTETSIPKSEENTVIDLDENVELEMEDTDEDVEEIPAPDPKAFVAISCSSQLTPLTTIPTTFQNDAAAKRKRMDSVESSGRISIVSEANSADIECTAKSRNEDYYKTLDSYMLQLPLNLQDDLKIEILNRVYCEIKKQKPF